MSRTSRLATAVAVGAAALLALTSCASASDSVTVTPDKLTIATGEPAYAPWVLNDDPASGEGFEAAVAYAVAEELGYAKDDVEWVRTSFDAAIAPGPKDFDLNVQQFSVSEDRAKAVDFSSPYYTTTQAVVAAGGTEAAKATSIADLKDAVIGVASGTTSLQVAEDVIAPTQQLQVFNNVDDTVAALQNGTIDALVTDLPGAFYVRDAQLDDGVIVGQLDSDAGGDEFAFVLPKGSELTADVTKAVDTLRENGTLDELVAKWIADQGAPVLK
ncbi:ABC transporter substrate-binding protein [Leucobacter luti]|uniref:Amino acid ABC transporter substrate-binding protein (PAAT family) n=1 Tax=Leucobacter luti TaxID=340320 RepID=A0A4Q7TUE8_9MICO|nr:ABC transporter substrate-binding protein [Leucobacter luti]MBL3698358.1 amino acid ABC transporter substrate-binding protein [Leucobacter luti]RZT64554.1 amino acid ABC transporter substrate-binding protein (PAAT family) [Leucobacter luti]